MSKRVVVGSVGSRAVLAVALLATAARAMPVVEVSAASPWERGNGGQSSAGPERLGKKGKAKRW